MYKIRYKNIDKIHASRYSSFDKRPSGYIKTAETPPVLLYGAPAVAYHFLLKLACRVS